LQRIKFIFLHNVFRHYSRLVFSAPKSIQATVTLLENLHIILEKTPPGDVRSEILPLLFNSFESNTMQIQSAALLAVANVYEYVDEVSIRRMVLPKIKTVFEKNQSDLKIMANVLQCIERVLDKLEKSQIIDEVLPMLYEIRLSDPEIVLRIVREYNSDSVYTCMISFIYFVRRHLSNHVE
jgi:SCY1-like protein 2